MVLLGLKLMARVRGVTTDADTLESISAGARVPGPPDSQNSFRSELYGIFGIVLAVRNLVRLGNLPSGEVTVASDSLSVLNRVFRSTRPAAVTDKSWELLSAVQNLLLAMPQVTWFPRHVRGHQDTTGRQNLDRWELRNVLMDERASQVYELIPPDELPPSPFGKLSPLVLNEQVLVSDFATGLCRHINGPPLLDLLARRGKFGTASATSVDWEAFSLAANMQPQNRRHWVVKASLNRSAVGVKMLRRRQWKDASCPRCHHPLETALHVYQCPHVEVSVLWDQALTALSRWFDRSFTHPTIASCILNSLRAWRHGQPPPSLHTTVPSLPTALAAQRLLGWSSALEGYWSPAWTEAQESYFRFLGRRNSGRRWLAALIVQLWNVSWDLWEHRNGHQVRRTQAQERAAVQLDLQQEYARGPLGLPAPVQRLFLRPLAARYLDAIGTQRRFLLRIQAARRRTRYRALAEQRRLFRRFFRSGHS